MQYKTIMLELLRQNPPLYETLRRKRRLLASLNTHASELKARHQAWKLRLAAARPAGSEKAIDSQALEFAVKEVEGNLLSGDLPRQSEPLSLEAAMAFIRKHVPGA